MTPAISTIAQGSARPLDLARIVSTIWSAPPESASSLPRIAPSAMRTPVPATVEPMPLVKPAIALSSGAPATAPSTSEPMVRERKACSLNLVISRTMAAMPASTAMPSCAWPAEVIGAAASAASISTLR